MDKELLYEIVDKAKKYDALVKLSIKDYEVCCSFCGKSQSAVKKIVAGPRVFICNECIELCYEILKDESLVETK